MSAPVLIAAGGTGGHVFPALAVAECLRDRAVPVVWLGTARGLEGQLVPKSGFALETIRVSGLRGTGLKRFMLAPPMLLRALLQAVAVLRRQRPRLVLGMGGFASGPGGIAARCLGIPLVIHEQNAIAGLTNRWLARLARRVLQAFPGTFAVGRQPETVGNPVRAGIAALPPPRERFAIRKGPARLLVLGGSQGARALNQIVPVALARLAERPEVRHQAGGKMLDEATRAYREAGVSARLEPFIDDMAEAYDWADLVLCRAGALTVSELAAAGVGALLVPFPHAVDDHQTANGRHLAEVGAARLLSQDRLTPERLADELQVLLGDRPALLAMAEAARSRARTDAATRVAEICLAEARS
ncbi:MAG: undecaprenyldiphospho-muramoylpentapeptide beta-N-acetylglucosaminyltransferase [Candidatus Competibacterales bacterium]|nr:undecaprenyldiphospho-muramoylpentapeptide beta-N-acetylglucosaminyltransferase [Candidatus Competibacterales bacterium]